MQVFIVKYIDQYIDLQKIINSKSCELLAGPDCSPTITTGITLVQSEPENLPQLLLLLLSLSVRRVSLLPGAADHRQEAGQRGGETRPAEHLPPRQGGGGGGAGPGDDGRPA